MPKLLILLIALASLTSCSVFSPVKSEQPTTYLINTLPPTPSKKPSSINLLVTQPEADPVYNTTDMAYTDKPYQIGYFAKSSWAETPSQMLQPLIIQTLRKTRYFHAVGSLSTLNQYSYILNTQLIQLQQDYSRQVPIVRVILRAQLVNSSTNQIVASKEFSVSERIERKDTYSGVVATNRAIAKILRQLAQFCLRTL